MSGNGGSSTDAQEMATLFLHPGDGMRALPSFCLSNDTAVVTALCNDIGVEVVFARQVAAFGRPADIVVRLRSMLGNTMAGRLMDCFYCLSLWIALPVTLPLSRSVPEGVLTWLALSGGACLLHGIVQDHGVVESLPPQTPELGWSAT